MKAARRAPIALLPALLLCAAKLSAQTAGAGVESYGSWSPSPYTGPVAPDFGGEVGLFTVPTGDTLPAHAFSLGLFLQNTKLVAGQGSEVSTDRLNHLYQQTSFQGSLGYGLTSHIEIFGSAGEDRYESRGGWIDGTVNGLEFTDSFKNTESRKIRLGAKASLWTAGTGFRLAIYGAADAPVGNQDDNVNTRRTDWEWGISGSQGIFTGNLSYVLAGRRSTDPDVRVPNRLRFAAGTDIPFGPFIHWITEIDRNVYDGPDVKPPDYSNLLTGARIFIGHTGWAFSAALGANIDMLARSKFSPTPIGALIGVSYTPFPAATAAARPLPAAETHPEEQPPAVPPPAAEAPAPAATAAAPAAAPAPQSKTTTDEIQFDKGGVRLTNIAKAILDGVALRMKNDLNSTAIISGYSDNMGSEEANMKISGDRAEAAKKYLVDRHGIDGARIKTEAKGSASPVSDNTTAEGRAKNRRAVIVVTFVSGS